MPRKTKNILLARLEYLCARTAFAVFERVPPSLAYGLARALAAVAYAFDGKHRRRVVQHLLHAGVATNPAEARRLARRNFARMGETAVDACRMRGHINEANIAEHISLSGSSESIERFVLSRPPEVPIIAITAHFGAWEFIGNAYCLRSGQKMVSIMRPFDNPLLSNYLCDRRVSANHRLCDKDGAIKTLLRALRQGESVGFVADQHARTEEGVATVFFGQPARTHAAPALLHLRTGAPIVASVIRRIDGARLRYDMAVSDPIRFQPSGEDAADIAALAQLYTSALEELIRLDPTQWLWAHRRWLNLNR